MIYSVTRSRAVAIGKKKKDLAKIPHLFLFVCLFLNQLNPFNVGSLGTNINLTTRINAEVIRMRVHPHTGEKRNTLWVDLDFWMRFFTFVISFTDVAFAFSEVTFGKL